MCEKNFKMDLGLSWSLHDSAWDHGTTYVFNHLSINKVGKSWNVTIDMCRVLASRSSFFKTRESLHA